MFFPTSSMRFSSLLSLLVLVPTTVAAATLSTSDDSFSFSQAQDNYRFGQTISLPNPITGDLTTAGATITLDEPISGNLQAAGQTVIINTTVHGNVRVAGTTIIIRGQIDGSILAMGTSIILQEGAHVNGDITALGENVELNGVVGGSSFIRANRVTTKGSMQGADIRAERLTMGGTINGNVVAAGNIQMLDTAVINGEMRYWTPTGEQSFAKTVRGKQTFDVTLAKEPMKDRGPEAAAVGAAILAALSIFSILSAACVFIVLLLLFPRVLSDAGKEARKAPWMSMLTGVCYFVALPVATILFAVTLIGLPIAGLCALLFVASLIVTSAIASLVLVYWIETKYKKSWSGLTVWLLAILCFIVLKLLNLIPVIGWIVSMAFILIGFGAFLSTAWTKLKKVL